MSENVIHVTDGTFQETVLDAELPTLVDFWAPWCGPCRIVGPVVEGLAKEYAGQMLFAKVNTDENRATPMQYGIRGIPTLILFSNGQEVDRVVGAVPKSVFVDKIKQVLASTQAS